MLRLVIIAVLVAAGGCARNTRLTLSGHNGSPTVTHTFPEAYLSRDQQGDYRIVLIDDGLSAAHPGRGPLEPVAHPPLRHIVTIRVFWRPMKGSKSDSPSASNAAVDWYVSGTGSQRFGDMVHYKGVGFARISRSGNWGKLALHSAVLQPVMVRGQMRDPLGKATLGGTVHARAGSEKVEATLVELEQARIGARAHAAAELSNAIPEVNEPD